MSALKSLWSRNVYFTLRSQLKSSKCRHDGSRASYSTESEPAFQPVEKTLPGRADVYEPDYLDKLKPAIPQYGLVDIQMRGYDYVVLERLQRFLHKYLTNLDVDVVDGWAVRAETWNVQRFAPNSSKPEATFQLKEYQRVLQLAEIPSTKLSIVIELIQALAPPGVKCSVVNHTLAEDKIRYIPDSAVKALQGQLDELGGPSKLFLQREKEKKLYS